MIQTKIKQAIQTAIKSRKEFYKDKSTTAFRIFNNSGDGQDGLTIDFFDGYYLITWYKYEMYQLKNQITSILKTAPQYKGLYQKKRFDTKAMYLDDQDDFIDGQKAPEPLIVKENNVNFAIYLDDGAMVGVFLDQREVRKTIRDKYAHGKTMLNTFSYTGAFSVFASLGGATKTTSVDLANRSLAKTQEQFEINGIDVKKQDIIVQDVFSYFKYAIKNKISYDLVVVDPPSFARSKKVTFSVAKDYTKLLKDVIQITNKGGIIVASTNSAKLGMGKFRDFISTAFRDLNSKFEIKEVFSLPQDFKVDKNLHETNYLKVIFIKKLK
jgi:23S rRNA (cytosine1962-C5)-methyltransferase